MKRFEYEQWTPCDCPDQSEPHYREQGGLNRWVADHAAYGKRLTDTEMAAEYWKAEAALLATGAPHRELMDRRDTLARFALHPHANDGGGA